MNKELIMKDFKKLREDGVLTKDFNTYDELQDVLSEKFKEIYDDSPDAQESFDDLNKKLKGLLNKHCGQYSLGTKDWSVEIADTSIENQKELLKKWNTFYSKNIKDMDELAYDIERRLRKDMNNAGCDCYNSLAVIGYEVFGDYSLISIDIGEECPRISFFDPKSILM